MITDHFQGVREPDENFIREVGAERNAAEELDLVFQLLKSGLHHDLLEHGALQHPDFGVRQS